MRSPDRRWTLSLCPLVLCGALQAQTSPESAASQPAIIGNAPINVSADRASYENGRGIYEGRVELRQGELAIQAERLIIHEQNREVDRILALGKPALLTQDGEAVRAEAKSIEYFVSSGKVILTERALIRQQDSEIRGNRITYDSRKQVVEAEGEQGDNPQRVNMTLQPRRTENGNSSDEENSNGPTER